MKNPETTEMWLSSPSTWLIILGAFLLLAVGVRMIVDILDHFWPDKSKDDEIFKTVEEYRDEFD